jgi:hypothetical protein
LPPRDDGCIEYLVGKNSLFVIGENPMMDSMGAIRGRGRSGLSNCRAPMGGS